MSLHIGRRILYFRKISCERLLVFKFGNFHGIYREELCKHLGDCKINLSQMYHYNIRRLAFYRAVCPRKNNAHFED